MAENDHYIKRASMYKKAQNKKSISSENYKRRWFFLYPAMLKYCSGDPGKYKDKGYVPLVAVKVIDSVDDYSLAGKINVFQIAYRDEAEIQLLYIVANSPEERTEWIDLLRQACRNLSIDFSSFFHPGAWTKTSKIFSCCHKEGRDAPGCRKGGTGNKENSSTASNTPSIPSSFTTLNTNNSNSITKSTSVVEMPSILQDQHQSNNSRDLRGHSVPKFSPPPPPISQEQKVWVAIYDFSGVEKEDLTIKRNREYEILDKTNEHWWFARDLSTQQSGYIPSNYVKKKHTLETHEWFHREVSRTRVDELLRKDGRVGAFLVRDSITQPGLFTLSIFTGERENSIRHYHIKQTLEHKYYIADNHTFDSVPDLVHYHSMNAGGISTRTRFPVRKSREQPPTAGFGHDKWEIDRNELDVKDLLGAGHFGSVYKALWKKDNIYVAVKNMREGTMSEENFIEEAKTMKMLRHKHLVQLYGVVSKKRPIWIVTEFMPHGSLHSYLRRHANTIVHKHAKLLDMGMQVCKGMTYLERKKFIHRDLAARNCLVGHDNIVKVADFGLTRYVVDDEYQSSSGAKFPIKWAPPEVLNYIKFSSKSDMWAFGVLLWEIFTGGEMPYGSMPNPDVVNYVVNRRKRLWCPTQCPPPIYAIMNMCWEQDPEIRPSFKEMEPRLVKMCDSNDYV